MQACDQNQIKNVFAYGNNRRTIDMSILTDKFSENRVLQKSFQLI